MGEMVAMELGVGSWKGAEASVRSELSTAG